MLEKTNGYNTSDLALDNDWTVEENKANSNLDALYDDILVQVGDDVNTLVVPK